MAEPLLSPQLLGRLDTLRLVSGHRSRSFRRGERRSRAHGHSVEFADHRNYVAGDDFRHLDWNLYGRLDRLFVKRHEEERERPVQVFLDASASMGFGSPSKFDLARRLTAALGYIALAGYDRVSVRVFPDPFPDDPHSDASEALHRSVLRDVRGKRSAPTYFDRLTRLTAGGRAELNTSLRRAAWPIRQPGVAFAIGDFLDPDGYTDGLDALNARGFQLHVVQILAAEELDPTEFGDLRLVDSESDRRQEVTFGRHRLKAYRRAVDRVVSELRDACRRRGIRYLRVPSHASLEDFVLRDLRREGILE